MKKILLIVCAIVMSLSSVISAQTKEEAQASSKRYEKLEKLLKKEVPGNVGVASIDGLTASSKTLMVEAVAITPLLENLHYRSIGESKDGVAAVTEKMPTVAECLELAARIAKQGLAVADAVKAVEQAGNDAKNVKGLGAMKAVKSVSYSKDALAIVGEESGYQAKAIAAIIETIKSKNNL